MNMGTRKAKLCGNSGLKHAMIAAWLVDHPAPPPGWTLAPQPDAPAGQVSGDVLAGLRYKSAGGGWLHKVSLTRLLSFACGAKRSQTSSGF